MRADVIHISFVGKPFVHINILTVIIVGVVALRTYTKADRSVCRFDRRIDIPNQNIDILAPPVAQRQRSPAIFVFPVSSAVKALIRGRIEIVVKMNAVQIIILCQFPHAVHNPFPHRRTRWVIIDTASVTDYVILFLVLPLRCSV